MKKELTQSDLERFTGTEIWHVNPLYRWMTYTDGVEYFAQSAGAYWFLDIVGTEMEQLARQEEFLSIHLAVAGKPSLNKPDAVITADDGNGHVVYTRNIDFTDAPAGDWHFFLEPGGPDGGFVLLLPTEH